MSQLEPRRIPLMPLAGLAIVLIAAVAAIVLSRSVETANGWVNHTLRTQVTIVGLGEQLAIQESGFRGYMIRGNRVVLPELAAGRRGVADRLAALDRNFSDNPGQRRRLAAIRGLVERRSAFIDDRMRQRDLIGSADLPGGPVVLASYVDAQRIRTILMEMFDEEARLLVERQTRTQQLIDALSIGMVAAVLLVVLIAYTTVTDARARSAAMARAHDETRSEMMAREAAEAQLRQIQKMESIGQLTGGLAHDLNNMLAVVIGNLDMARRRADDPARVAAAAANALEGAQRASALVARLLAFARRQPLMPARIDPNRLVGDMKDLLDRTIGERIVIATELTPAIWPVHADPGQLENAILNLALNARDAMPDGGTLTLSTHNRRLGAGDVAAWADVAPGDYAVIAVCDEGTGMTAEVSARAFDPFFTTKPVGKGTGLGLSQVFGFVKQSGGHVVIEPREDGARGSIVRLLLPRSAAATGPGDSAAPGASEAGGGSGERILVVEDDERVRSFSIEALRELGYAPVAAENGATALDLLRGGLDPALLFTDIVMPGLTGPELASIVRETRPDIRILFTTGFARERAASLDPAIAVLPKPFTVAQLATRVREALAA